MDKAPWTYHKYALIDLLRFTLGQKALAVAQLLASVQRLPGSSDAHPSSSEPQEPSGASTRFHSATSETDEPGQQVFQSCSFLQFRHGQIPKPVNSWNNPMSELRSRYIPLLVSSVSLLCYWSGWSPLWQTHPLQIRSNDQEAWTCSWFIVPDNIPLY